MRIEVKCSIQKPDNPAIKLPSWQYINQTGQIDNSQIEEALNQYIGEIVLFPLFDHTCADESPDQSAVAAPPTYGCSTLDGAHGANTWYRIPQFVAFKLEHAYTNGNNLDKCDNISKQCLIGEFVKFVVSGTVGPGTGGGTTESSVIGVQLIQ